MSDKACVLCNSSVDDALQLGEKFTCEDTTVHYYCLLLTSNLVQNGNDDEGITGFMPKDIKAEVSRTKKLVCHYCHEKSATIGCCSKSCRRSFHLPCALENDCRLEFTDTYRSFCDAHHDIKRPKNVHKPTDLCTICYDEMGEFNLIRSIPLPCCNKNAWCHKLCLQQYAQTSGYFLKCPLCKDEDKFRNWIAERGVFIPDRDAKWEIDDGEPNRFYDFQEHSERPSECEAKICKCYKGRKYQVDVENSKHSLVCCHYCGSHAAHLGCFTGEEFLCEECTTMENQRRENAAKMLSTGSGQVANGQMIQTQCIAGASNLSNNSNMGISTQNVIGGYVRSNQHPISKFKLRDFSICLRRLTQEDLGFTLEPNSSEYDTVNTSSTTSESSDSPTDGSSSDASVIKVVTPKKKCVISTSNSESEIEIKPAKRKRLLPRNQFFDSDSDFEEMEPKVDINKNSTDLRFSNVTVKKPDKDFLFELQQQSGLRVRQFSSSEEEQIRPTGSYIRKPHISDSSDEQNFGKENEKPLKSIAVVRPFSLIETSSDESIKPVKLGAQSRQPLSSSDETYDDFPKTDKSKTDQFFKKCKQETTTMKVEEKLEASYTHSKIDTKNRSPSKKKRRTVVSYFRPSSSSDEELIETKPKRKSPKTKQRTMPDLAPNQATIMDFFKKQLHHSM